MNSHERARSVTPHLALPEPTRSTDRVTTRVLRAAGVLMMMVALAPSAHGAGADPTTFKRVSPQYIASLGDPGANSGSGAEAWGLWRVDPGPRGVSLDRYERLKAEGGIAPAQWKFDSSDWWLEENGLLMEK